MNDLRIVSMLTTAASLLYMQCGDPQPANLPEEDPGIAVNVETISRETLPVRLELRGNIRPWEQVLITGANGTRINKIYAETGDAVRKGQRLVQMNNAQLAQAEAQLQLTRRQKERLDTLLQIGSISQQQFDQAETEYENALSAYNSLREDIELTSPINGVVTEKYFLEGEAFLPSPESPAILEVMQLDPVKVVVNIAENYYGRIEQGMTARISVDNYPDTTFEGVIYKKYPTINEASRTFQTEIEISNDRLLLRPGMFARVMIDVTERQGLYIPYSAIIQQPGTSNQYVFIIQNDSARRVSIQTGVRVEDRILAESGLSEGQKLVTEGMSKLENGDRVRIIEES